MENTRNPQSKDRRRTSLFDAEAWERFMTLLNPDRDLAALEHEGPPDIGDFLSLAELLGPGAVR